MPPKRSPNLSLLSSPAGDNAFTEDELARASRGKPTSPSWANADRVQCSTAVSSASGPMTDGGSFAESFALSDGSIAIGVWDVSGRGKRAAATMRLVRAGFRAIASTNRNIAVTASLLNRVLYREVARDSVPWPFVTGLFGIIDADTRILRYVSCGHETAIHFTVDRRHAHLPPSGPALGICEDADFRQGTAQFAFGDILAVVTAGITDARPLKSQTDFFGTRGLCALFQRSDTKGPITASSLVSRTVAYSDGRLDNDAAALIARFA
jgi:serine phosphatase RsbU (regulator of sigma subunit)